MIIRSLKVTNFRNYDKFNITFGSNMNIFIGSNGSGKTNILESISLLGLTKSFRNVLDIDLIKFNKATALIEGRVNNNKQLKDLKITLRDKKKEVFVNDKKVKRYADYISNLNIIVFSPLDLEIIKGSPSIRRNLLNVSLSQISYQYLVTYNEYNKILKTRNEYLKILYTNSIADISYLDILTDKLVEKAVEIYMLRYEYLKKINENISNIYEFITLIPTSVKIVYKPNVEIDFDDVQSISDKLKSIYKKYYKKELQLGMTIYGPHRDDFLFYLDDKDMKLFSSQGQQKCAVLAYKLSSIAIFKEYSGTNPVLLLDDIFSELDLEKRNRVLKYINKDIQSIITTTDLKNISKATLKDAVIFKVDNGKIERS